MHASICCFALACAMSLPAAAQPPEPLRLARVFGEHAVLQRERPIPVWGWGPPGTTVEVLLAGARRSATVAADGRWRAELPPLPAGGPHTLEVQQGGQQQLRVQDVLVGDVWLAGGQSNMAWPLAQSQGGAAEIAAADAPTIRQLRVPNVAALRPQDELPPTAWLPASPATAGDFSAVAWHFAKRWQAAHPGVPVGLVTTAWNGSHLETWVRRDAALQDPDLAAAVQRTPADLPAFTAARRAVLEATIARWQPGLPWQGVDTSSWHEPAFDDGAWPSLQVPLLWESQGLAELDGVVWFRRSFDLNAAQAASAAPVLHLGKVDDCDETYLNGRLIGRSCGWDTQRVYPLPAGLLREGRNQLAVRVIDNGGGGGFHGDPAQVRLDTATGPVPLDGRWRARIEAPLVKAEPVANDGPSLAHNALHQPLQGLPLRGVLWYQGESNVGRAAAYASLFQRFISDWREQWGQPQLPFFWVQLAAFNPLRHNDLQRAPWAELREAQRQALQLPHTGMAVATDVGEADDIHPRDKHSVGERLAALALHDEDPRRPPATGPQLLEVRAEGEQLRARFGHVGGGLRTRPAGAALQGFAIAGADGRYHPALARIEGGDTVLLSSPAVPQPLTLRYGWVDNPAEANLCDGDGLPASPRRSDELPLATREARYGR
jgi:sialate O-acetylesterase